METTLAAKVTQRGARIPRRMAAVWGDVEGVEIKQRPDAITAKPKGGQRLDLGNLRTHGALPVLTSRMSLAEGLQVENPRQRS